MRLRKYRTSVLSTKHQSAEDDATRYHLAQIYGDEICAGTLIFTDEFMENGLVARKIVADGIKELRTNIRREVQIRASRGPMAWGQKR